MTLKKGGGFFAILFLGIIFINGCETAKGAACGVASTVGGTVVGAAKDTTSLWKAIIMTDNWLKDNLW